MPTSNNKGHKPAETTRSAGAGGGNPSYVDPVVERVGAMLKQSGLTPAQIALHVGAARGHKMSPATVSGVMDLQTTRPSNYTLDWLLWAIGFQRVITTRS